VNSMNRFLLFLIVFPLAAWAQGQQKEVKFEYKKFERFDFEEIAVEGEKGAPGDLSIAPTPRKDYENRLPERKNFNKEIRKSASGIR
jgi:hypothetical protein